MGDDNVFESGTHLFGLYYEMSDTRSGMIRLFPSGRFSRFSKGCGGSWYFRDGTLELMSDSGSSSKFENCDFGFFRDSWALIRSSSSFWGFWPTFDPRIDIYKSLLRFGGSITSSWGGVPIADLIVSGENARVTFEGERFRWRHGCREGIADFFLGVPLVDSPEALHVPHFYDYWSRLGSLRPARVIPSSGISWVASYAEGSGDLVDRRLEVARGLARWFPLAVPRSLKGAFGSLDNVSYHDVPWTLMGKYDFLSRYAFNLCFENSTAKGYLTEKPFDALISGAVPVYQGDPNVFDWIDEGGIIECSGLEIDEIANRIRQAEIDGITELVWERRESMIKVSLEEMVGRVRLFTERITSKLQSNALRHDSRCLLPQGSDLLAPIGMNDVNLEDLGITVVIKTILRPEALRATLDSFIAVFGDGVPIVVVDDSPAPYCDELPSSVRYVHAPFDIGLSAGRNLGVSLVETEFVFLSDDDSVLESSLQEILECVRLLNNGLDLIGSGAHCFEFDEACVIVAERPIDGLVRKCDITQNFFIARTSLLKSLPWDEELKLHPEHEDFFLRLKRENAQVAGTGLLRFRNLAFRPPEYAMLRRRSYIDKFERKWGFDRIVWRPLGRIELELPEGLRIHRLNICLDSITRVGWVNIGRSLGDGYIMAVDCLSDLPIASDSCDFVYLGRVIERLPFCDALELFGETMRILRPGGVVRIATYDFSLLPRLYGCREDSLEACYVQWFVDEFLPNAYGYDASFVINGLYSELGCRYLYDNSVLSDVLESVGFCDLSVVLPGESRYVELCGLERSEGVPSELIVAESLIVEARKGGDR